MSRSDMANREPLIFPNGARFAFTVLDDTDDATLENVRPIYEHLASLGMRTTKTVWPFKHEGPSHFWSCETMEDPEYLEWVLDLQRQGFEITWHGATFESSKRERTLAAIDRLRELFDVAPRVHANHAGNEENLYWGPERVDLWILRRLLPFVMVRSFGHVEESPFWWGDACAKHVRYGRNLTFNRLNTAAVNPSMPYQDPRRPLVPLWFSASDAESVDEFNLLTSSANQDRLEREGGFSIVATHFGKQFVREGVLNPTTKANLDELAQRPGWFPTVGELLDWLVEQRGDDPLPAGEWRRMQIRWALDTLYRRTTRHLKQRLGVRRG